MTTALSKTLQIVDDLIPVGNQNRPGRSLTVSGITVHNTDNSSKGADATAHGKFLRKVGYYMLHGQKHWVSWHYTVDDTTVHQHLPVSEIGWHAGPGNATTIGIEICMCAGIDQKAANVRAGVLVAGILNDFKLTVNEVYPHHHWTSKNCPILLLDNGVESKKWDNFKDMVEKILKNLDPNVPAILSSAELEAFNTISIGGATKEDSEIDLDHGAIVIPDELVSK